jgi:hypothetical protein
VYSVSGPCRFITDTENRAESTEGSLKFETVKYGRKRLGPVKEAVNMVTTPTALGPKNDSAGETSSNCKLQTSSLVRESAAHKTRNWQFKNLVVNSRLVLDTKIDWPTEHRS